MKSPAFETTSLLCHSDWFFLHAGIIDAGGIGTETCEMDNVFPPDDL